MTTMTMNAMNASIAHGAPRALAKSFDIRAALPDMPVPDMPVQDSAASIAVGVAGRMVLAAVPFSALGWLFFAV